MTRDREKFLERVHLLRTLINYGPASAVDIAERANSVWDDEMFAGLPEIKRRGITSKLNGMSLNGMVTGWYPGGGKPMVWEVTAHGRRVAEHGLSVLRSTGGVR
jgi:hypothetical protein